jgi:putative resolvase
MLKFIGIREAANYLGVTTQTLRRWEKKGILLPTIRTKGNQRRYDPNKLASPHHPISIKHKLTLAYARVSSHDQKTDLERQRNLLELYCTQHGWTFEIISDLGSGMNYHKKGLKNLINLILEDKLQRLVLTHKDRLLRFGAELIFSLCELKGIEVVIINQGKEPSFEEELAQDVLEIITVFSARLYGARSRKNKILMDSLKKVAEVHP